MSSKYDRRAVSAYLDRLVRRLDRRSTAGKRVVEWLSNYEGFLEIDTEDLEFEWERPSRFGGAGRRRPASGLAKRDWQDVCAAIAARAQEYSAIRPGPFERNLAALVRAFELDDVERGVLEVAARYSVCPPFEGLCDELFATRSFDNEEILAAYLDIEPEAIWRALGTGNLLSAGLVTLEAPGYEPEFAYRIPYKLRTALLPPNKGLKDVERALLGTPLESELAPSDYDHVAQERDFLTSLLANAIERNEKGINVLLYGPPGTGKTELCKTLATEVGADLYGIGERGDVGQEPMRGERLSALLMSQQLASRRPRTMLLLDEMEDFLQRDEGGGDGDHMSMPTRAGSRVFLHRLLEENPVPTLWTANRIEGFEPAFLRRMTYAMELTVPPAPVRVDIWRRLLARYGMTLEDEEVREIARRFDVAPALAANAVRSAQLAGAGAEGVILALNSLGRAVDPGARFALGAAIRLPFVPELANADVNLVTLSDQLVSAKAPRNFSLCLYGPPGTGKSAFVRHLAERLGMETRHVRASDLLSAWVGKTEQQIAQAFHAAEREGAFLVIDEADSLLYDRIHAVRSWEVTQVNEMLTWMERHPLPFACTTNLMENLDRASLRRFTFKVRFGFLSRTQIAKAFDVYFGLKAPPETLAMTNLTPGDFAVASKRIRYMTGEVGVREIAGMLRQECELKPGFSAPLGFMSGAG